MKPMKITANEQSYQSIYLDPSPKTWQERIVFHDPILEEEMAGVIVLKSLELENLIGLVVAAPLNVLRHLRELVKEKDTAEGWGKLDAAEIVAKLVKTAKDLGAVIAYEQLGGEVPEGDEAHFFDPATQRQIVQKGPHFFDPSLVTMEDVEKITKKSENNAAPQAEVYPRDISAASKHVWDYLMPAYQKQIFKYPSRKERWAFAKYLHERECEKIGIAAYEPVSEKTPIHVFKQLKNSRQVLRNLSDMVFMGLKKQGLARQMPTRETVFDVRKMGDNNYYLTTAKNLPLEGIGNAKQVVDFLARFFNFYVANTQSHNCYKPVSSKAKLTFSEDRNNPNHVRVFNTYLVTQDEANLLCEGKDENDDEKVIFKLTNLLNRWLKTGRLKQ